MTSDDAEAADDHPPKPKWSECPIIEIQKPRCPKCSGTKHVIFRTQKEADGSTWRKAVCRCGQRFLIVIEPMECGPCQFLAKVSRPLRIMQT